MKNITYKVLGALLVFATILPSCDKGFEEINTDPINILETTPDKLLAPALVNILSANMMRNRNFNNELMQVTVSISDGDATVFRYEYRRTFSDYLWNAWFVQVNNLKDIYKLAGEPEKLNKSYQGISLISQAWVFSLLTDTYGDVPYSEAGQGKSGQLQPKFDAQKDIYLDLFKKLEEANTLLTAGTAITKESDPVYNGDVAKWRKFGNSLYLRLLLRISEKSDVSSSCIAKIKEIAETNSASYPTISNNAESATIKWSGEPGVGPYVNPYYNGVRAQDFRAASMCKFFMDNLRDWQDPRINLTTYANGGVSSIGINPGSSGFSGVPSGYNVGENITRLSYFYSYEQLISNVVAGSRSMQQSPLTGILMNYAELQFILAEAAAKGWISGAAEGYYYKGMANSINYWSPKFPADPNNAVFKAYVTNAELEWNAGGSMEDKMEQIHLQKYYALFMVDMQQWFEYRRTSHPILPLGPGLKNNREMPARMAYPVYVQSANPGNYNLAVANQGGDEINTKVWWQKR
ncbi:SusD/RagB family nutrient-binding outer membrane lipoprotein [Pedobacter sp. KBW06]|uniref:SusD/RagB family nutrient-binding outer membrane lipoprotein n=1 Tax=Pedobacter sp. KBW06 TaxID=2153359 RepID=UPI000F5A4376|nr:SusD/RagB family nutrient-binding outer membrane lipoprotein [Pedobacter sp. KBW06]RQO71852.1 SusD/RagB family nutrient-binding outer membrane lipoprotein [Pedobacter sp. KBW06]